MTSDIFILCVYTGLGLVDEIQDEIGRRDISRCVDVDTKGDRIKF